MPYESGIRNKTQQPYRVNSPLVLSAASCLLDRLALFLSEKITCSGIEQYERKKTINMFMSR